MQCTAPNRFNAAVAHGCLMRAKGRWQTAIPVTLWIAAAASLSATSYFCLFQVENESNMTESRLHFKLFQFSPNLVWWFDPTYTTSRILRLKNCLIPFHQELLRVSSNRNCNGNIKRPSIILAFVYLCTRWRKVTRWVACRCSSICIFFFIRTIFMF